MSKQLFAVVGFSLLCVVASTRVTGAKWTSYDADRNLTTQSAVLLEWQSSGTVAVQIWGRRAEEDWRPYSKWMQTDAMGSTGTLLAAPLTDGFWSWAAVPWEDVRPVEQFSFWVRLVVTFTKRWILFR